MVVISRLSFVLLNISRDFTVLNTLLCLSPSILYSTLVWKIPWTEDPGRLQSMGLLRV